eukprot:1356010-Pleurochrysis_carterae.AAC.1
MLVAFYRPIAGFKVADGAAGNTLVREDVGVTLDKFRSSACFGFNACTDVVGPPAFQSANDFLVLLWNEKFGLALNKSFDGAQHF